MKFGCLVLGRKKTRLIKEFDARWEAETFAANVIRHHPEINVFVAPIMDRSQEFNFGRFE